MSQTPLAAALLEPATVAIVGASDDPRKTTGRPQRFLAQARYRGTAWFVNPRRDTVQGEKAYPSLSALPGVPDHVYVMTGADAAVEAVAEAARLGVPVVTVLSSGFAEEGEEGLAREDRLRAAAALGPTRVVGPSSLGVVNPRNGVMLTGNAAFGEPDTPRGGIFVASQSGSVIGALVSRARGRGIGFAGLVSTGGEADLSLGEICTATLDDPEITSYALFLESLRHSRHLAEFAAAAHRAGKPVAVYKLGRSEEAAALTVSHTGALAGEDTEADAFFRACGFARVSTFEGLAEAPALLERIPAGSGPRTPRVGVVTTTGGGAAIMVDQLALRGVSVRAPSHELVERMAAAGAPVPHSLISDLGLAGARHDIVTAALRELQDSGEYDLIVFVIGSSARLNPELAVQALADRGGRAVPVVGFALPDAPDAAALLAASGVPAFRTPETCADAVAAAFARRTTTIDPERIGACPSGEPVLIDEQASAEVLTAVGVPVLPSVAAKTASLDDVELPFGFPVVVKALSDQLAHKTDVGGVMLNVGDADGVREAARRIVANVARRAGVTVDRVLVQPMAEPGVGEVLVGFRRSHDVGPVVVLSTGGVQAELYDDVAVRLAPVDRETALEMIDEVRGLLVLNGHRGAPAGDVTALADAVVAMSDLAHELDVVEAEANPVLVRRSGAVALDALVRRVIDRA